MNRLLQLLFSLTKLVSVPLISFFTLFLGIHFYGKENWGEFISITIWIYFIAFLAKWSGQNYLIREMSKNTTNYINLFYSNILDRSIFLVPSILFFFAYPFSIALASQILLIVVFLYNSFDALIIYKQKLHLQFFTEVVGIIVLIIGFVFLKKYDTTHIILLFVLSFLIKIIILLVHFKPSFKRMNLSFSIQNIIQTFPFFLIGFSGWLSSKTDIYVVSYFFEKVILSEYQMLISCFLILQALPSYIIMPINLHLFRLTKNSIQSIKKKLFLIALLLILIVTILIRLFLSYYMKIEFSFSIYFFAALSTLPAFQYTVDTMQLMRNNQEKKIMVYSFITAFLNLVLMLLLIPYFKIQAVVIAICISQWVYLFLINKKIFSKSNV